MNKRMKGLAATLLFTCIFLSAGPLQSQNNNLKKQVRQAELLFDKGQYADAAELYEKAWLQKNKKDYIYKAGACYLRLKAYGKAAKAFDQVSDAADRYPLAAFYKGRSLKQDGQYEAAQEAFQTFIKQYKGANAAKRMLLAQNELEGCDLALKWNAETSDARVEINKLGEQINTVASEFAPVNFSNDILYYSSNMKGQRSRIFRSQRSGGQWSPSVTPEFPVMPEGQVANGAFSSDNKRFYFTICRNDRAWQDIQSECDLYVISRQGSQWSPPEKLRDYIKMDGTTATHPFVVSMGNKEYLYYVTDRTGGKGGLDIWYTSRLLDSDEFDFTLPQNAGAGINTAGDEVTPFYDLGEKTLYFASDGHPSVGGLDIFKSKGREEDWGTVVNIGMPYNSSADDYYFVRSATNNSGFFVSNRTFGMEKISTTDEDIFSFGDVLDVPTVKGQILSENGQLHSDLAVLSLFEIRADGQKRLLQNLTVEGGSYTLSLIPGKKYQLEASNRETAFAHINFNTFETDGATSMVKDIQLQAKAMEGQAKTVASTTPPPPSTTSLRNKGAEKPKQQEASTKERTVATTKPPATKTRVSTPAAAPTRRAPNDNPPSTQRRYIRDQASRVIAIPQGIHFKIQFKTALRYDANDPAYSRVKGLGRIDTEYLAEKNWTRVLLADYYSEEEAYEILKVVRQSGFPDAFLVKYRSGKRLLR
ncbi:MAG: hypothetical protein AAF990_02990 [Bacteroidota bacterium]